jgi:hypothetical protein
VLREPAGFLTIIRGEMIDEWTRREQMIQHHQGYKVIFRKEDIEQRVALALKRLELHDAYLLENDCNERSITHRLAMYLQSEFEGWDVDCEYNRDVEAVGLVKRLSYPVPDKIWANDTDAKTVFPDIIVHHRETSENLLVIEVKKSTNRELDGREKDRQKLQAFKDVQQLAYSYALFLLFNIDENAQERHVLEWI